MKQISFLLTVILFCGFISPVVAQSVTVRGKHKDTKKWVKVTYIPGDEKTGTPARFQYLEYDNKELTAQIKELNEKIAQKERRIKELENKSSIQSQPKHSQSLSPSSKTDDTLLRQQNNALLEEKWDLEDQLRSLQDTVRMMKDSLNLLNISLEKVNNQLAELSQIRPAITGTSQHVGAYYRIGNPWLFNSLLNQKEGSVKIWSRKVTFFHQVGVCWNSASFSDRLPMTYGVGLEYNRLKFSAGISNLKDVFDTIDIDGDHYTEYLTYNNVNEEATMRYISIPLTFSIGTPRVDRISGYFQASLVPSILFNRKENPASASGTYSRAGLYNHFISDTTTLDFYLDDFAPLGFVSDKDLGSEKKEDALLKWRVLLSGRFSGGVYIPLCKIAKGENSPWALKVGINLDISFPIAKQNDFVASKARYQLDQYNLLSGRGSCCINPGLEVGILYIFNK